MKDISNVPTSQLRDELRRRGGYARPDESEETKVNRLAARIEAHIAKHGGMGLSRLRGAVCSSRTRHRFDASLDLARERGSVRLVESPKGDGFRVERPFG